MLDRVLKLIVTLTLLLFLAQAVVGLVIRSLGALIGGAISGAVRAGSLVGSVIIAVVALCFFVGVIVRAARFIGNRDPRTARERASRDRAVRQRVRRPAEGVLPVTSRQATGADPDPAIGEVD
jgi:hypothetical protein